MTPRPAASAERWTVSSLKDYMESLITANDERYSQRFLDSQTAVQAALNAAGKAVDAALSAAKEAVIKAETANEKRFSSVDELRKTIESQQRTFMPRSEQETVNRTFTENLADHGKRFDLLSGQKSGARDVWGYLVAFTGLVIAALTVIYHR